MLRSMSQGDICKQHLPNAKERWRSGRSRRSWKPLTFTGPGVRIPLFPQERSGIDGKWKEKANGFLFLFYGCSRENLARTPLARFWDYAEIPLFLLSRLRSNPSLSIPAIPLFLFQQSLSFHFLRFFYINNKWDNITRDDLLSVAYEMNVKRATKIIDQVSEAVSHWRQLAHELTEIPQATLDAIEQTRVYL